MEYIVKTKNEINFEDIEKAEILTYKWTQDYTPKAFAQLILIKDKGFAVKLTAYENKPKTTYFEYNSPVYKDSCLEFFVSFNNQSPLYLNLEMNSAGAFLAAVRKEKKDKTPIHELIDLPIITTEKTDEYWSVQAFLSFKQINILFGEVNFFAGYNFKGNFYKCGDETAFPHFGMWAPIESEKANFHLPEYFGTFIIE